MCAGHLGQVAGWYREVLEGQRKSCPGVELGAGCPLGPTVGLERGWQQLSLGTACCQCLCQGLVHPAAQGSGPGQEIQRPGGSGAGSWGCKVGAEQVPAVVAGRGVPHPGALLPGAPDRVREDPQVRSLPRGGGGRAGVPDPAAGGCQPPPAPASGWLQLCPRTPNTGVSQPQPAPAGLWDPHSKTRDVGCHHREMGDVESRHTKSTGFGAPNALRWGDLGTPTPIHQSLWRRGCGGVWRAEPWQYRGPCPPRS